MNDLGLAYNLLFVEEPWVLKVAPDGCSEALTEFVRRIRAREESAPRHHSADMTAKCYPAGMKRHWGFYSDSYNAVLQKVAVQESLRYSGFIGHSFGAARLGYLRNLSLEWSILTRPFPVGANAQEILNARAHAIESMQKRATGHRGIPQALIPAKAERRFDYLSALIEVGYAQPSTLTEILTSLSTDTKAAQRLAQQYWAIYGLDTVSPAYLAYLEEVCSAAKDWPYGHETHSSVISVLKAKHSPCNVLNREPAELKYGSEPRCIVTSSSDTVTPEVLVMNSILSHRRTIWVSSKNPAHASFDRIEVCLKRLADEKPPH